MDKKDEFKNFVKKNPKLINYVKDGTSSWQKFYELYDLYGEEENAWKEYLTPITVAATAATGAGLTDLFNWIKNIDIDGVQSGIGNVQRVLGMVQDLTGKNNTKKEEYKPRPVYKHFED